MLKVNRVIEYALLALRCLERQSQQATATVITAKEISDCYGLSFEVTAKTLQKMKEMQLVDSSVGSKGGYVLKRALSSVSFAELLQAMEGPRGVVMCVAGDQNSDNVCELSAKCEIKKFMHHLNQEIEACLSKVYLSDLV